MQHGSGMSPWSNDPGRADLTDPGSEQRLLNRVRRGSSSAVAALVERYAPWLRRRASGRLPQWARSGGLRPAIWWRTCCITPSPGSPSSSRSTSAPCAPISGAPWRTASRTSCDGPSAVWTSPASPRGRNPNHLSEKCERNVTSSPESAVAGRGRRRPGSRSGSYFLTS